jgi:hypothetical protein
VRWLGLGKESDSWVAEAELRGDLDASDAIGKFLELEKKREVLPLVPFLPLLPLPLRPPLPRPPRSRSPAAARPARLARPPPRGARAR